MFENPSIGRLLSPERERDREREWESEQGRGDGKGTMDSN